MYRITWSMSSRPAAWANDTALAHASVKRTLFMTRVLMRDCWQERGNNLGSVQLKDPQIDPRGLEHANTRSGVYPTTRLGPNVGLLSRSLLQNLGYGRSLRYFELVSLVTRACSHPHAQLGHIAAASAGNGAAGDSCLRKARCSHTSFTGARAFH